MNLILAVLKFIGSWASLILAIVLMARGQHDIFPGILVLTSIAFSQAPVWV
jgi:ABC-type Fe3+-siderophore transport system permease subunit